jgi:hypothetical protein
MHNAQPVMEKGRKEKEATTETTDHGPWHFFFGARSAHPFSCSGFEGISLILLFRLYSHPISPLLLAVNAGSLGFIEIEVT